MTRRKLLTFIALTVLSGCSMSNNNEKIEFNREEWLQGDRRTHGKMVHNIIEDSILYGKTKAEVLNLLGNPTASDTIGSFAYVVDIGLKIGPLGMGGTWLFFMTVQFDTINNKVQDVWCRD